MRFACELMHKTTGAPKVVVVRLPKEEANEARRQGHAMLPCAKGYAVVRAQKLHTDVVLTPRAGVVPRVEVIPKGRRS